MREHKAAFYKHHRQITQAQLIPQSAEHDTQDDIGGVFQKVERGAGAVFFRCFFVARDEECRQFMARSF